MKTHTLKRIFALTIVSQALAACAVFESPASSIDAGADEAIQMFSDTIGGADVFLDQAAGYLVFPRAVRAGLVVGAETGEGVLRIDGRTVDYFRITSGSLGLQAGAQARSIIICFMTDKALQQFQNSNGWRVGVDGSVALIDIGAGKTIDSQNIVDPVVGFIFNNTGLMANLTLEGTRFTRLER